LCCFIFLWKPRCIFSKFFKSSKEQHLFENDSFVLTVTFNWHGITFDQDRKYREHLINYLFACIIVKHYQKIQLEGSQNKKLFHRSFWTPSIRYKIWLKKRRRQNDPMDLYPARARTKYNPSIQSDTNRHNTCSSNQTASLCFSQYNLSCSV